MAIKENEMSQDDIKNEEQDVETLKANALSAILPTLNLPGGDDDQEEDPSVELDKLRAEEQRELRRKQKDGQSKSQKKYSKKEEDADDEDNDDKEEDEEDKEEDLIPRSKVDKRFKELTAKIKELESIKANAASKEDVVIDADQAKLDKMTPDQLKQTLKDVRTKSLLLASSEDPNERSQVADYVDLEMKIHNSINSYSTRFYNSQVSELDPVIASIEYDEEIEDPASALKDIKQIAENIYQKYPKMQSLKSGMKQAYQLAIDHYKLMQDKSIDKSESKRVRRENTRLKRKTTLDTSKIKGNPNTTRKLDLIRKKIQAGTTTTTDTDRAEFVKESPMFNVDDLLPESFK